MLEKCDILFVNLSIPNRLYIGCIYEIVYAKLWKKINVVYLPDIEEISRPWLVFHADYIFNNYENAIEKNNEIIVNMTMS